MKSYTGHEKQQRIFLQAFTGGNLHHAWILAGPRGLGKAGFAKQAARILLDADTGAPAFDDDGSGQAAKLLAAGSHPDFRLLRRGPKGDKEDRKARDDGLDALEEHELKRNVTVDQVRSLQSLFSTQSSISQYRVVVIDAIDDLERGAANALLKNLEEPPQKTIFLLVSHSPDRLLPTIRSRCQLLRFDPLDDAEMERVLRGHRSNLHDDQVKAMTTAGEGSPGRALQYADVDLAELEMIAQNLMCDGDPSNSIKSELARKLSLKAATPRYRAFLDRAPSLIARRAREVHAKDRVKAIEAWREASDLADMAIPKALDSQAVVFRMGSLMASLAQTDSRA